MNDLTHVSLFSGIGGIDLAAEWAGFRNVLHCEIDPFCVEVLKKHWPEVPTHGDIRTLTASALRDYGAEGVTVLSGGFPCQPFSTAGKRKGTEDSRHLWPYMLRVIRDIRPSWVLGENVGGFVSMALDDVCEDLEAEGYQTETFVFPASAVGAAHQRYRTFVLANANRYRLEESSDKSQICGTSPYRESPGQLRQGVSPHLLQPLPDMREILSRPEDLGASYGLPGRVDRLRALGNAVVPQQVYPILSAIAAYERLSYFPQEEAA